MGRLYLFFNVFASRPLALRWIFCPLCDSLFSTHPKKIWPFEYGLVKFCLSGMGGCLFQEFWSRFNISLAKTGKYLCSRPFCLTRPSQRPVYPCLQSGFDSSTGSDVSDKVADFPLVLAGSGHCAKIIDVRACAANAYLTSQAPHILSSGPAINSPLLQNCSELFSISFFDCF